MQDDDIKMKKFDTDDMTMNKLLNDDLIIMEIPVNQRKYSWDKEEIEKYWTDIVNTITDKSSRHYLGVISLIKKELLEIDLVKYELIDGQQRLITTLIFLSVLRDLSIDINGGKIATRIQEKFLTVDTNRDNYKKLESCKLDKYTFENIVNISGEQFKIDLSEGQAVNRSSITSEEEPINRNMIKAYKYFYDEITTMLNSSNNKQELILDLLDIMSKIEIITVISGSIANMFLYFDSLNNRGLHLNAMDILRNNFFKIITERFNDKVDDYSELWDNLVLKLEDFDSGKFLKYYYICEKQSICPAKDLPDKFERLFDDITEEEKMTLQIRKMLDYAQIYISIFDKNCSNNYLNNINFLGQQACHSFIMDYIYNVKEQERRNSIYKIIENMMFKRILCSSSTKQLDGIFRDLITKRISNNGTYNDDEIYKEIQKDIPNSKTVINEFDNRDWKKDNIIIYTLFAYEKYKNSNIELPMNKIKTKYSLIMIKKQTTVNIENMLLIENEILECEKFSFLVEIKNKEILKNSLLKSVTDFYSFENSVDEYLENRKEDMKNWLKIC